MAEFISFRVVNNGVESRYIVNLANIAMVQIEQGSVTLQLHVKLPGNNNAGIFTLSGQDAMNAIDKLEKCL